jgi:hypothetical protein
MHMHRVVNVFVAKEIFDVCKVLCFMVERCGLPVSEGVEMDL